ncbi:class I SAM-dependent methyltransferase [Amycolatopsis azurea]|uniref:class I SAM-dependent methyltransferase n=1 Tax=Amycolatopsis azurea TaxID=36819 RepID=UPI003819434E
MPCVRKSRLFLVFWESVTGHPPARRCRGVSAAADDAIQIPGGRQVLGITACDQSAAMVDLATRGLRDDDKVRLHVADIDDLPFPRHSFDIVPPFDRLIRPWLYRWHGTGYLVVAQFPAEVRHSSVRLDVGWVVSGKGRSNDPKHSRPLASGRFPRGRGGAVDDGGQRRGGLFGNPVTDAGQDL